MDEQTIWILERNTWDRVAQHHLAAANLWFDARHSGVKTHFEAWLRFCIHWRKYKEAVHLRELASGELE